jgi:hypothetical protein
MANKKDVIEFKRNVRLNKPSDCRKILARCINACLQKKLHRDDLRAVSTAVNTVLKSFEVESEIAELQKIKDKLSILETTHGHY